MIKDSPTDEYDFTKCPFNPNHKFGAQKYFHHITRCKDGLKVRDQYQNCEFNSLHIFLKSEIEDHQLMCPDGQASLKKKEALNQVFNDIQNKMEGEEPTKEESMAEENSVQARPINSLELQECPHCHKVLEGLERILITVSKKKRDRLRDLLEKYQQLWRLEEKNKM